MPSKGCDITDFIQDLLNATNVDGSRKFTDAQIKGKVRAAYRKGLISKTQIVAATGQKDLLMTEDNWTELEDLTSKVAAANKPIFEVLSTEEVKKLIELSNKARNSIGFDARGKIDQQRLVDIINEANETKPQETIELLSMIDSSIKRAELNGNKQRVAELRDLKDKLMAMNDLSSRLKIDWNAIAKTNKQIEKLTAELAAINAILEIGDRDTAQKRKDLSLKILDIVQEQKKILADSTLSEDEKQSKLLANQATIAKLQKELSELTSPKFLKASKKLQKRAKTVKMEIRRLQDNAPNAFFNRVLLTISGSDPNFYITSLRELKQRQLKTKDDITLVRKVIDQYPTDKQYTLGDIQSLFGEDITTSRSIKHFFYEKELNDDGTEKKDSSNQPILKKKEFISKDELEEIFTLWETYKTNKTYESSITTVEATAIKNQLLAGDKKLPEEVDPLDPLSTGRTHEESLTAKPGYKYNPAKLEDRVKVVQDLHSAMQRLSYVASLGSSRGILSQGMLIGILGNDAQSLIHKFDPAIADDLELDNPYIPTSEISREGRLAHLESALLNLGYTTSQIQAMPEFAQLDYVDNFTKVVAVDIEWEKNTNNIVAISLVEFHGGSSVPVNVQVLYSKKGNTEIYDASDAQDILNTLERYQNNGFKVVGHNFLGQDSDMQKLVSVSGNTKQGLAIAHRMLDTMLLTFRNSPEGNFSRQFGPSLDNLAKAFLGKSKSTPAGVTGETAYNAWKDGRTKEFEDYIISDSALTGQILLEMVHRKGSTISVENRGKPQEVFISDVTPMWYDTGKPEAGRNQRYTGVNVLYDIQSFRNYRQENTHGMHNNLLYEMSKVRNIMTNIVLALVKADKPEDIEAIFAGINAREKDAVQQIDTLLEISRTNQEAYLPILREMRTANRNQFILQLDDDGLGGIAPVFTSNTEEYNNMVVDEILDTIKNANRGGALKLLNRFADTIKFRKYRDGEEIQSYVKELFEYTAAKFNNKPKLKIEDFGNGQFDYVPALQVGRGFAQIILGDVEDGLTLSQSVKTPVEEIDRRREEARNEGKEIGVEDPDNLVEKREYLPISKKNVSYFAPLSMFEQERAYDDYALRERYFHILNRDLSDKDIEKFQKWRETDKAYEYKQSLRLVKKLERDFKLTKATANVTMDTLYQDLEKYFSINWDKNEFAVRIFNAIKDNVEEYESAKALKKSVDERRAIKEIINKELKTLSQGFEKEFTEYTKQQDFGRLSQGRVQRYNTVYMVNNRDIYTRIPSFEETQEMALEIALDLPQYIATFVHDSVNLLPEDRVFLSGPTQWEMPELSSGGPTGAALLAGIHPQLAWLMSNPEVTNDPEMMKNLVLKSFENGREVFKTRGYSRTTYWDDNMSGLHHILMLLWSYFPDQSYTQEESILNILNNIKTGNVGKSDLTDYYTKTYEEFLNALDILRNDAIIADGADPTKNPRLAQIEKIKTTLGSTEEGREFFKGAVVPVLYTGGYPAVLEGLRKKKEKLGVGDPLNTLSDEDLQFISNKLTATGAVVKGRLVDEILGLEADKIKDLMDLFTRGTNRLTKDIRQRWVKAFERDKDLENNHFSIDAAKKGIELRIRYIAELTMPARLENANRVEQEAWIQDRMKQIQSKWQTRIDNAVNIAKKNGGKVKIGSQVERDFHVALAGDESAFKNQQTLIAINQMQASGLVLNSSDRDILEAAVMTGRYISKDDIYYRDHIVFTTVGLGSGGGSRAQYVGNYLTNLHGNRLSKGNRLVFKDDGTIDWKDTVTNSAWSLFGNPYREMSREKARKEILKDTIKTHLLIAANDYPPTMIGYNPESESRANFFKEWSNRTKRETEWQKAERLNNVEKLKNAYGAEGRTLTDEQIEKAIASSSTPFNKRIGTRVLAPDTVSIHDDTIMSTSDAKGLAAFRPRLADNPFQDRIISGLYNIYQEVRKLETGIGSMRRAVQKIEEEGITPERALDMSNSRGTMYDPETLGVYFPEMDSTLLQELFGYEPTFNQRRNQLKFLLDTFAVKSGLEELSKTKQYARLLQIYKIRKSLNKFASLLSTEEMSTWDMRFLHRHFIQQMFKITKAQRDAQNVQRNVRDFSKSIAIDPSMFRNKDGSNMMWIDVLGVLADLGIEELGTIEFGMAPVELLTTSVEGAPNVLKGERTSIMPNVVQGSDVAIIIQGILSNLTVKEEVRKFVENLETTGVLTTKAEREGTTNYILVASLPPDIQQQVLNRILNDDQLTLAAVENLGLHVTMEFVGGKNFIRFQNSKFHAKTDGAYVVPRRGLGTPTVNTTVVGEQDIKFFLTPEGIKNILKSARNSPLFTRIETAVQIQKSLGGISRVDQLRRERYAEYLDKHLQSIAEETELLSVLEEGNLQRLGTTRLRDELGLELDLYDAETYFTTPDDITGLTPFKNAITLDIRIAMERAKQYPALQDEYESLNRLMTLEKNQEYFLRIGFMLFLKNNLSRDISDQELRILMDEHFGSTLNDTEFNDLITKTNQVSRLIDRINHSPFKGKNKYLAAALKHRQQSLGDPSSFDLKDVDHFINELGIPSEDYKLAAQAVKEAYFISSTAQNLPETYLAIPTDDLIRIAGDPNEFENAFPEGAHINNQLTKLRLDNVIDEETELFYRFLIAKVIKHNPNLAKFLSISTAELGSARVAEAVKTGDKFTININPVVMKQMGRVDQVRVFAHEISHIARLAFIRDNGPEWRRLESLFRSQRGRAAIETMLLVMNNNKKYIGFDQDLNYYLSNPEEFIAQWGSWILMNNTFNNEQTLRFIQSRSSAAHIATKTYETAFHRMRYEILKISSGLTDLDEGIFADILDITENMFGFTSSVERQIQVGNADKSLGLSKDFETPISSVGGELDELAKLHETFKMHGMVELVRLGKDATYKSLMNKYQQGPLKLLDAVELRNIRRTRESVQGVSQEKPAPRVAPAVYKVDVKSLEEKEKMEIATTVVNASLERGGKLARNLGTVGGLSRQLSEQMFGKKFTDKAVFYRFYLGTMGLSQARSTYMSDQPIAAALMHIIGETMSITTNQFIKDTGARSIRENRVYAQQWVERVMFEIGQLQSVTNDAQFNSLLEYAFDLSMGIPVTAPVGLTTEIQDKLNSLTKAMSTNSRELANLIYGKGAKLYDDMPTGLDKLKLGARKTVDDPVKTAEFERNRQELIDNVAQQIVQNVLNDGAINSTLFYASGLGPQIGLNYEYNTNNNIADVQFRTELKRVQNNHPGVFAVITEIMVRDMLRLDATKTEAEVRRQIQMMKADANFLVNGSPKLQETLFKASHTFYRLVNKEKTINGLVKEINKMGTRLKVPGLLTSTISNFELEVQAAIVSTDEITTASDLFFVGNKRLPDGVSNINAKSSILLAAQTNKNLSQIMAGVFLSELGDYPDYLQKNSIVTGRQMRENKNIAKFLNNRIDLMLVDLERSKGFRATSKIAIQDITGVAGLDIYDLISIFRELAPNIAPDERDRRELTEIIDVIEQKLQIEQGLNSRGLSEEDDLYTNWLLKWGPDITRLAYGPNLNTASLIMEGGLGAFITFRYGGNALEFVTDIFNGLFGELRGVADVPAGRMDRYNPRGLAINMMRGIEQGVRNGRDIWTHVQDYGVDAPTKWDKYKVMMSRVNNAVFESLSASLTNQAQRIIVTSLNNGNLIKLKTMMNSETLNNMDELQSAMNKYNIRGILPHMVYELKVAGVFEPGVIEAYNYMLNNVSSKYTKDGTLDFVAANKWIENHKFTAAFVSKEGFNKATAYRAVAAMYNASKNFRDTVIVDRNPWDMNTHRGALRFLHAFYRQFPNLFFAQKMIRQANKMDTTTYVTSLIALSILDLIYNTLLQVALGALTLSALYPWSDEFVFKKNPSTMIHLFLSRNPVFGLTGNIVGGTFSTFGKNIYNAYGDNKLEYGEIGRAVNKSIDEISMDIIPLQAIKTVTKDPIAMFLTALNSGGNLNEQETHDVYNGLINSFSRTIPILGELPVRIAMSKLLLGEKPNSSGQRISNLTQSRVKSRPELQKQNITTEQLKTRLKENKDKGFGPIKPPSDLLR